MCGRYALFASNQQLQAQYGAINDFEWEPRYNIAPTDKVPLLRLDGRFRRRFDLAHWGFEIEPGGHKKLLLNARAETVTEKPTFKGLSRTSRCILPASGFFEWKKENGTKVPWFFQAKDEQTSTFALAGLLRERAVDGDLHLETTILTTAPNDLMAPIHDRMPVIVPQHLLQDWLNPHLAFPKNWALPAFPSAHMSCKPASTQLNHTGSEGPALLVADGPRQPTLF